MQKQRRENNNSLEEVIITGIANSGKTTLFNGLTGDSQRVGNWHGVTTCVASGYCKIEGVGKIKISDLPGSYFSDKYTLESSFIKNVITKDKKVIIVCEGINIKKGIDLYNKISPLCKVLCLIINMNKELEKKGGYIDEKVLQRRLRVRVVKAECNDKKDVNKIKLLIGKLVKDRTRTQVFYANIEESEYFRSPIKKNKPTKLDYLLFSKFFCALSCLLVFVAVLYLAFGSYGLGSMLERIVEKLFIYAVNQPIERLLSFIKASDFLFRFVTEGVLETIFSLIVFLPRLAIIRMFTFFLEESGFLARIAFTFDPLLKKVGISGRALFALLSGYACTVSGVLCCNGLENKTLKNRVIGALPYLTCSAKAPVYLYVINLASLSFGFYVLPLIYFLGLCLCLIVCMIDKRISGDKEGDFIIEFPPYRLPTAKSALKALQKFTKEFIIKVGLIISAVSLAVWLLNNLTVDFNLVTSYLQSSILQVIATTLAGLFKPIGLNDTSLISALLCGLVAKESVISTMHLLGAKFSSLRQGIAFLWFIFAYPPCVSALITIGKECGIKGLFKTFFVQTAVAYVGALYLFKPLCALSLTVLFVVIIKRFVIKKNKKLYRCCECKNLRVKTKPN